MSRKLDIFALLAATDRRDQNFYGRLDADAAKEFAPPVALRWASAIDNGKYSDVALMVLNDRANIGYWDISDHPELQYRLIASSGVGQKMRHHWLPQAKQKRPGKLREFISRFWPDANSREIDMLLASFTEQSFRDFVDGSGLEPKEIKEMIEAYARHINKEPEKRKSKGKTARAPR